MPADQNDIELIQLYESRNEQAIAATQAWCGGFCYSMVYRILGNAEDSEECVSDAMLHLWNAIPPAKPKSFRAFLITLTKRLALERQAQNQAEKRILYWKRCRMHSQQKMIQCFLLSSVSEIAAEHGLFVWNALLMTKKTLKMQNSSSAFVSRNNRSA